MGGTVKEQQGRAGDPLIQLSDEDQEHIRDVFEADMVPKLAGLGARLGMLNCGFAGERYRYWSLRFRSAGSGFEIVEFEYDEEGDGIDLDI